MNAKRIGARLIAATMTVGAMMSVAAPAWAATQDPQSETPEDMLQEAVNPQTVEDAFCGLAEEYGEGVTIADTEFVGSSSCPESGLLTLLG